MANEYFFLFQAEDGRRVAHQRLEFRLVLFRSIVIAVVIGPKAITIVPTAGQGKVYGADEPTAYGYELADDDALAFDDELTDIVSGASREAGEDVGAYDIELVFEKIGRASCRERVCQYV